MKSNDYRTPPPRSLDIDSVREDLEWGNTLEIILPQHVGSPDLSNFLKELEPTHRSKGPNGFPVAAYKLRGDTRKEKFLELFCDMQSYVNCRITRNKDPIRDVEGVPLGALLEAFAEVKEQYPNPAAPIRQSRRELANNLMTSMMHHGTGGCPIIDIDGSVISRDVWEGLDNDGPLEQNAYGSYRSDDYLMGVAFPANLPGLPHFLLPPSATFRHQDGSEFVAYSLSGSQAEIDAVRRRVATLSDDEGNERTGTVFPLPVGDWHLSADTAEMIEFDEPLRCYSATSLDFYFRLVTTSS
jgi:hypothetical protein